MALLVGIVVQQEKEERRDDPKRVGSAKRDHCRGAGTGGSSGNVARRGCVCLGDRSSR